MMYNLLLIITESLGKSHFQILDYILFALLRRRRNFPWIALGRGRSYSLDDIALAMNASSFSLIFFCDECVMYIR